MEDIFQEFSRRTNESRHTQKRPTGSCSDFHEQTHDFPDHLPFPNWVQSQIQPGMSSGVDPNPIKQAMRKRRTDQAYRERCRNLKTEMQSNMANLKGENDSLKKENDSLKDANSLLNQTLRDQENEIELLRSNLIKIKREYEQQNVLVQTLSGILADPMRLENEKLRDENASLRKNANLSSILPQLAEENVKLRNENKVLRVQNDALCGKIISDNDKKSEHQ